MTFAFFWCSLMVVNHHTDHVFRLPGENCRLEIAFIFFLDLDADKIQVCDGESTQIVSEAELSEILAFLKKYRIPFLNFWNHPDMDYYELKDQIVLVDFYSGSKWVWPDHKVSHSGTTAGYTENASIRTGVTWVNLSGVVAPPLRNLSP